tara:strand:+ start:5128 stop:5664 length:537 start_codon:yes stop_codon:yes gene_type:complete
MLSYEYLCSDIWKIVIEFLLNYEVGHFILLSKKIKEDHDFELGQSHARQIKQTLSFPKQSNSSMYNFNYIPEILNWPTILKLHPHILLAYCIKNIRVPEASQKFWVTKFHMEIDENGIVKQLPTTCNCLTLDNDAIIVCIEIHYKKGFILKEYKGEIKSSKIISNKLNNLVKLALREL